MHTIARTCSLSFVYIVLHASVHLITNKPTAAGAIFYNDFYLEKKFS